MADDQLTFRTLQIDEIGRIGEVNREELLTAEYEIRANDNGLSLYTRRVEKKKPQLVPRWSPQAVQKRIDSWRPALTAGGWMGGIFDGERLVGFAIVGPKQKDSSAELVALFVDKDFRRQGVGARLMTGVYEHCQVTGVSALFLYANPTDSAVSFYRRHGFKIQGLVAKEIVASLPGDIIMARSLAKT